MQQIKESLRELDKSLRWQIYENELYGEGQLGHWQNISLLVSPIVLADFSYFQWI